MNNSTLSRRSFIASVLAASSAPLIVPAQALGRDGAVAPSERITMGFIGQGGQGSGHLFGGSWTYVTGGYLGRFTIVAPLTRRAAPRRPVAMPQTPTCQWLIHPPRAS